MFIFHLGQPPRRIWNHGWVDGPWSDEAMALRCWQVATDSVIIMTRRKMMRRRMSGDDDSNDGDEEEEWQWCGGWFWWQHVCVFFFWVFVVWNWSNASKPTRIWTCRTWRLDSTYVWLAQFPHLDCHREVWWWYVLIARGTFNRAVGWRWFGPQHGGAFRCSM